MFNLREFAKRINITGDIRLNEPMAPHTTFRTGGSADLYIRPRTEEELVTVVRLLKDREVPSFVVGGGANILVADEGIRGAVIALEDLTELNWDGDRVHIQSGMAMSRAAWLTGTAGFQGLEGFYAMPGSLGGPCG